MVITPPNIRTLPVEIALKPLNPRLWDKETAAHLLRRISFSATPDAVKKALKDGPENTIKKAFTPNKDPFPKSEALQTYEDTIVKRKREIYKSKGDQDEKRRLRRELRREENEVFNTFAVNWFNYAKSPQNSAREKYLLFLQDIFVVERQTVRQTPLLYSLQETLRNGIDQNYPDLCKAVSKEPAMVLYLDLDENKNKKPNENFARELFELFTLGEGNYSEKDIKEAARAFTGYRVKKHLEFHRQESQFDNKKKTIFGETGNWNGDDVIDITFKQPAARTFFVREFIKFYLSDQPIDDAYIEAIGNTWANHQFNLQYLINTIFQSTLFYHPAYQGTLVKSPTHFYIGMCQDLQLDIIPFHGRLLQSMRAMGQSFYNPPNVRGWLYGQHWINSTTISARRQVVNYLFRSINYDKLNGNDQKALEKAKTENRANFLVTDERLEQIVGLAASNLAAHFTQYFITAPSRPAYKLILEEILSQESKKNNQIKRIRDAIIALLQSPAYNLC